MTKIHPDDVLIAVDVQNDFMPGGALAVADGDAVVPLINRLGERFRRFVVTQDWHTPDHLSFASAHQGKKPFETIDVFYGPQTLWPDHCIMGTEGAAFHSGFDLTRAEVILRKGYICEIDSYSALFENDRKTPTGLAGYLRDRGFRRVFLCGLAFDFCVRYSAEDAVASGFAVSVIEDACRGIDLDGSVAETRRMLATLGVPLLPASAIG